ncbi:MAG: PQQ-binding-like beta-propeller repeat protein [Sedimentisphaerales bacterium]|nr:PQQ-binding-like beta-propeller repeat protein [Sedimentisphaerales bacterium]
MGKSQRASATALFTTLLILSSVAIGADSGWSCWMGPNRDGKSLDTGLLKKWPEGGPKLLWQAKGLGVGFSTVSVSDNTVYATGDSKDNLMLFAFDMNGKEKWRVPVDKPWTPGPGGSRSTPTVDDGRVYVLSGNGVLACMDAKSGKLNWSKNMRDFGGKPGGWGYAESVLIHGNLAIAKPGGENCIVAFNKTNGEVVWKSTGFQAGPEYGSCVSIQHEGVDIIATGTNAGIVGVSAKTGELLWLNDWCKGNTANCPDPQYADGYVFWANGYGKGGICLKLKANAGKVAAEQAWTTRDMVCHHGGYIIHEGYIYGNHNGGWSCLELKTGKFMWNETAVGKGSLCFADGMLYLFGENGGKAALATCSPDGMQVTGNVTVEGSGPSWAHPVVTGGRLYLRFADNLYCFDVKAG